MGGLDRTHFHHCWTGSPDQSFSPSSTMVRNEFSEASTSLRLIEGSTFEMLKQAQTQLVNRSNNANNSSNFGANALSAAGAAFLSAVIVNPLDVAKTRLQAQAAGVPYAHPLSNAMSRMAFCGPNMIFADLRCSPTCTRAGIQGTMAICPADCFHYKGTVDVLYKVARQEGVTRLWRGTNAALALAVPMVGIYLPFYDTFRTHIQEYVAQNNPRMSPYVPCFAGALARSLACTTCYPVELARTRMQAFKDSGKKPSGIWKTLMGIVSQASGTASAQSKMQSYRVLWTGLGAQLARDVPYSAICWSTLEPIRRKMGAEMGNEANAVTILGSNFTAGFAAGSLAAGATCPLDVARTRRQIEKDPAKGRRMSARKILVEIWRDGGMRGLFAGAGPRVARAGPSVGIVVSFYEVVKHILHNNLSTS